MTAAAYYDIDVPGECRHESRQQQSGKYCYISQFVHSLLLDQRSLFFVCVFLFPKLVLWIIGKVNRVVNND